MEEQQEETPKLTEEDTATAQAVQAQGQGAEADEQGDDKDDDNGGGDEEDEDERGKKNLTEAAAAEEAGDDEETEESPRGATAAAASGSASASAPSTGAAAAASPAAAPAIQPLKPPSRVTIHKKRAHTVRLCLSIEGVKPKLDLHSKLLRRPSRWTSAEPAEGDLTVKLEPDSVLVEFVRRRGDLPHRCFISELCARIDKDKSSFEVGDGFVKVYLVRDTTDAAWEQFDLIAADPARLDEDCLRRIAD